MSQALQVSNSAADLAAAATRIKELMKTVAVSTVELGAELKRVRDDHFPMVHLKGRKGRSRERTGWDKWLSSNFKLNPNRASILIRVADQYGARVGARTISGTVLEEMLRTAGNQEIEQEIVDANEESIKKTGKPLSKRKARAIIRKHKRKARGERENEPQLPTAKEAERIAKAEREKGNIVLIPARDGNFYTGADPHVVAEHERVSRNAFAVEYALDTLSKIDLTPHEFMQQTPVWLRWWRTKSENVSTKGEKIADVARWLTAFAAAVDGLR